MLTARILQRRVSRWLPFSRTNCEDIPQQLRQALLLRDDENFSKHIKVTYVHIKSDSLLQKLP